MAGGSAAVAAAAKARNSWVGAEDIAEVKDMRGSSNSSSSSDDAKSRGTTQEILSRDSKKLSSSSSSPKRCQFDSEGPLCLSHPKFHRCDLC